MAEEQVLQQILSEIKGINAEIMGINSEIMGINGRLDTVDGRLDKIDGRLDKLEKGQVELKKGQVVIVKRIDTLEEDLRFELKEAWEDIERTGKKLSEHEHLRHVRGIT